MILKRFYDDNLAQASYLVGCEDSRTAIIVDPNVELSIYTEAADREKLVITHVTETHVHADFLSGSAGLAKLTGAELCLSAEGSSKWGYDFSSIEKARALRDGDEIAVGAVRLQVIFTPGHTPEHISFLVTDTARGTAPVGALTGDFLFVGDIGRPDLLEVAAGAAGTTREAAGALFDSVQRFRSQPDHIQIWPGHGAGSACGKDLGAMPSSTLGYEKLFNWAFQSQPEKAFVDAVLTDQPVPPRYFAEMKRLNRLAKPVADVKPAPRLPADTIASALLGDSQVVDARPAVDFAAGHIPGTINVPFNKSFLNWMGAIVDSGKDLILILPDSADQNEFSERVQRELGKIGIQRVRGWVGGDALQSWRAREGNLQTVAQLGVDELHDDGRKSGLRVIDVRSPHEWAEGHIEGAIHVPLAALAQHAAEIANGAGPIAVHCRGGGRAAIAASLLQAHGADQVMNLSGGYDGWVAAGYPVEHEESHGS
jgi:hydroxyacylglutathione hydrolase